MNEYLVSKLKEGRINKGLKQSDVTKFTGIKNTTLSNYENGITEPDIDTFLQLCELYELDYAGILAEAYGLSVQGEDFKIRPSEIEVAKKYRFISTHSPDGASVVDTVLDREYSIAEGLKEQSERIRKADMEVTEEIVPTRLWAYYGKIAAAGTSVEFSDMIAGTKEYPVTEMNQDADYVIGVNGDSMEPEYFDGDIVFVKKATHVNIGDVGIFQKDNNIYIKKAGEDGLVSLKAGYPIITSEDGIRVWGKVLGKAE